MAKGVAVIISQIMYTVVLNTNASIAVFNVIIPTLIIISTIVIVLIPIQGVITAVKVKRMDSHLIIASSGMPAYFRLAFLIIYEAIPATLKKQLSFG